MAAPTVTALRKRPKGRLEIELDGESWRILPAEPVLRAGVRTGAPLDRERARSLARQLRRSHALATALRALKYRDLSTERLSERLTQRGVAPSVRDEALETLARAGLVDNERFARSRAQALAERNYGDAAIRHDLEQQGIAPELIESACGELSPEAERATLVVEKRGRSAKTLRYLAGRGFDSEILEEFAQEEVAELG